MTWTKFALWLLGVNAIYYGTNILWDLLTNGRNALARQGQELTFAEPFRPVRVEEELSSENIRSSVIASGGLSLKELFYRAQQEAIEYTRHVSF
jgi:hypothetical protein